MTIPDWIKVYLDARDSLEEGRFEEAVELIGRYRELRRYDELPGAERRENPSPKFSVIIVSRAGGTGLLQCLESICAQDCQDFEIILVDNGKNEDLHDRLRLLPMLHLAAPINFHPSEGRNIAAAFARGEILVFIDDDGIAGKSLISSVGAAFDAFDFIAVRGRIFPPDGARQNTFQGHYDLGPFPIPSLLDTEGVAAVVKSAWQEVGGMDPLIYGGEGVELSRRLLDAFPGRDIYYWPTMELQHEFPAGDALDAKKARHKLTRDYLAFKKVDAESLAVRYGRWRAQHPAGTVFYDQRNVWTRLRAYLRESLVRMRMGRHPAQFAVERRSDDGALRFPGAALFAESNLISANQRLNAQLKGVYRSTSYRMGALVSQAIAHPLRHGAMLLPRIGQLAWEHWRKDGAAAGHEGKVPQSDLDWHVSPGIESHRATHFRPVDTPRRHRLEDISIGFLGSEMLRSNLACDINCLRLNPADYVETLKDNDAAFVLLEPRPLVLADRGIEEILRRCRKEGFPVVAWHGAAFAEADERYEFLVRLCDLNFASDEKSARHLGRIAGESFSGVLRPAIQPALHNPAKSRSDALNRNAGILYDGWADLLEFPGEVGGVLESFRDLGLFVTESRWQLMARTLNDLPQWRKQILGCLSPMELLTAWKLTPATLMVSPSLSSDLSRTRRCLEAICCGCRVVSVGGEGLAMGKEYDLPPSVFMHEADAPGGRRRWLECKGAKEAPRELVLARRNLMARHTYRDRINAMLKALGKDELERSPLVTVVIPTKRPEMIEACVANFERQTYRNKELVLVLNTHDSNVELVRARLAKVPDASLMVFGREENIGSCLNGAIMNARGELWFKMDDDDIYGAHYLEDMVNDWAATGADVVGKAPGLVFFEKEGTLYSRSGPEDMGVFSEQGAPRLCGATLGGTVAGLGPRPFAEDVRGSVDSWFFHTAQAAGKSIYVSDPYNYVTLRNVDNNHHTWRDSENDIREKGTVVGRSRSAIDEYLF